MTEAIANPTTKPVEFDGTMENAYGSPLKDATYKTGNEPVNEIAFKGKYEHILSFDAIPVKERLSDADILKVVNDARKANARQKAMQEALDAAGVVKPTLENSPNLQLSNMVKSLVASGKYTEERAIEFAKAALGQ